MIYACDKIEEQRAKNRQLNAVIDNLAKSIKKSVN